MKKFSKHFNAKMILLLSLQIFTHGPAEAFGIQSNGATTAPDYQTPFYVRSTQPNQVQIIQNGLGGLQRRIEMIEKARTSIDIEYFIYNMDQAGRLITQALLAKKKQNPDIKIRLLVDASPTVLQITRALVSRLTDAGIEVRFYNATPLISLIKVQYRDHRKLLVVDGPEGFEAITGSRNIADEYFELHKDFNFRDRDIWINGPIIKYLKMSFELYWNNQRVSVAPTLGAPPKLSRDPKNQTAADLQFALRTREYKKQILNAKDFITENSYDRFIKTQVSELGKVALAEAQSRGVCDNMTFVTDKPGFDTGKNAGSTKRQVLRALLTRINKLQTGERLWIESPYFIIDDHDALETMDFLDKKHIKATLLTNGLSSTDAFYVAANFVPRTSFYQHMTASDIYIYSGDSPAHLPQVQGSDGKPLNAQSVFGLHSKTYIFGTSDFGIGTFNVDPRSANLNSELMLICEDNLALTKYITSDIEDRIKLSRAIKTNGLAADGSSVLQNAGLMKRIKFYLSLIPSSLFECLM
jgi:putative cardiolipin synthase